MRRIYCLVVMLFTASLFAQADYAIGSISPELMVQANSVLIDELVEVDVTNIAKMRTKTRRVVAVLNPLGKNDVSMYEYYDKNSRVKKIEARVYNAMGDEISRFRKRDFIDVSRTGNNMYADSRMLYVNYTPSNYPYIVVFESETESGDSAFILPWQPLGGYAESTQKSVFKIKFDQNNTLHYSPKNIDNFDISISEKDNELTFTATNLKSVRYEEHSPSHRNILPYIKIALKNFNLKGTAGTNDGWQKFGSWVDAELLSDVMELPEGTKAKVRDLVAAETTNEGKARKIYQFVQDKVRYISIQIGIGGWKPMPASEVDKLSYGDCKALTIYTKSLLDAVDVPSYYTLVNAGENILEVEDDFAMLWFNHAILAIPDGEEFTWLECTSQDTPYGYIAEFTDDRDVLIMTPEGGKIVRTKVYEAEESTQENFATVKIDAKGNVKAKFEGISKGIQYGQKYLVAKKKPDEIDRYYKSRWNHINGFSISGTKFKINKKEAIFTETMQLDIANYANSVGNEYLFCPNIFNRNTHVPPRIMDRKQHLYIGRGFVDTDTVEVEIPAGFVVDTLPEQTILETQFGKYEIAFTKKENNKVKYVRKLHIEKGEYPPSEYENYREFLRAIARLDKTNILLKSNSK